MTDTSSVGSNYNDWIKNAEPTPAPVTAPAVQAATPSPSGGTYESFIKSNKPPTFAETGVTPAEDLGKSISSGMQNIGVQMAGMPSDIADLVASGSDYGVKKILQAGYGAKNYLTGQSGTPEAAQDQKNIEDFYAKRASDYAKKRAETPFGSEDIAKAVDPYAEKVFGVGPAYKPVYPAGETTKEVVEFVGPSMIGKEKTAVKLASGLAGYGASEVAGKSAESAGLPEEYQVAAKILGAVVGGAVVGGGANIATDIISPTASAQERVAQTIARARAEGRAATQDEINQALSTAGTTKTPMSTYDLVGGRGAGLAKEGTVTKQGADAAAKINDFVTKRADETFARVDKNIDDVFGRRVDAEAAKTRFLTEAPIDNGINYDAAMKSPNAANVSTPYVQSVLQRPLAAKAVDDAVKAFEGKNLGTLKFHDEVKRNLDYQINAAYRDKNIPLAENLKDIRTKLVTSLDNTVPEYKTARNVASEYFGASSALEAGYKYAGNLNAFKTAGAKLALDKYSPDQLANFQEGFLSGLKDKAKTGAKLVDKLDARDVKQKMSDVLGTTKAETIDNMVQAENIISDIKTVLILDDAKKGFMSGTLQSAGVGAGGGYLVSLFSNPNIATGVGAGAAALFGGAKLALTAQEQRIAGEVNRLLSSTDPQDIKRLSDLATKSPVVKGLLDKVEDIAANASKQAIGVATVERDREQRAERASGGRISMAADRLVREAMKNQRMIGNHTEQMLSMPDDAIVSALDVAKKTLGGAI